MSIAEDLSLKLTDDLFKTVERVTGIVDDPAVKRDIALMVVSTLLGCIAQWEISGRTPPPQRREQIRVSWELTMALVARDAITLAKQNKQTYVRT